MPTEIEPNELLIRCTCGDRIAHVAWLIHNIEETNRQFDSWYLMLSMDPCFGFWRRLKTAASYLFRPRNHRWAGYAELVLRDADVDAMAEFVCRRRNIVVDAVGKVTV